uniref:Uncharacterized protein n=1 Tax=Arundo donax TaxID=35708 RepID=A0A0A9HRI7_ARUDO
MVYESCKPTTLSGIDLHKLRYLGNERQKEKAQQQQSLLIPSKLG